MKKYLYRIRKFKIKPWIKYWLLNKEKTSSGVLSEILTGTNFTLENSLDRLFNKFDLKGNTSQNTSTQSANLFDEEKYKNATYTTSTYKYTPTDIKGGRTLYFRAQLKSGATGISGLYLCISTNGANPNDGLSRFAISNGTITGGSTNFTDYTGTLAFSFYPTNKSVADIFNAYNFWVSTDNTNYTPFIPNSPSPDYPSVIHTVNGSNNIKIQNKNEFDKNNPNILNTAISGNGTGSSSPSTYRTVYVPCKPNTTYIVSKTKDATKNRFAVAYCTNTPDYNMALDGVITDQTKNELTITTGVNANYLLAYVWISGGTETANDMVNSVQIHIAGGEQNLPIDLGDIELCKIGTAQDYIYKDSGKWYLHKELAQMVFDGSNDENWIYNGTYYYFTLNLPNIANAYLCSDYVKYSSLLNVDVGFTFTTSSHNLNIKHPRNNGCFNLENLFIIT